MQLEGNSSGNAAAAIQAAGSAHWRCGGHLEAAEGEDDESQARQERRQGWQSSAAVVEAAEELYPPASTWLDEGEQGGQCRRAAGSCR